MSSFLNLWLIRKDEFLKKWLGVELKNCPVKIVNELDDFIISNAVEQTLEDSFNYYQDLTLAQKNYDYCQVKGAKVEDYLYRNISTPLGEIVTSIRFMNGNVKKPFVLVVHKNFEINQLAEVWQLNSILSREYALFKPQRISWFSNKIENEFIQNNDCLMGDMVFVSEFIKNIKQLDKPKKYKEVTLKLAKNSNWYNTYKNEYDALFAANPAFAEMAQVTKQEVITDLINKKLLYEIVINGEWAGIIAANKENTSFYNGYCIYEELLIEKFRGQKLAPAVQRHFIEKLPTQGNEMVYGTIHYDNIPSLKTATKVGRQANGMFVLASI